MNGVHADEHDKRRLSQAELWLGQALVVAALMLGTAQVHGTSPSDRIPVTQQTVVLFHSGRLSLSCHQESWGTVLDKVRDGRASRSISGCR